VTTPRTSNDFAETLRRFVIQQLEAFAARSSSGLVLPSVFGGRLVTSDARADLAFTLGHLRTLGVTDVAGQPIDAGIIATLRTLDGASTDTFASYRAAEVLLVGGVFADNELLAGWSESERQNLIQACDSSHWIDLLDGSVLPRNYAAVLARCELARARLGLLDGGCSDGPDHVRLQGLVQRTKSLLGASPVGPLDDSTHGVGRYDIYSADVWLFAEPLATAFPAQLGPIWREGSRFAVDLVDRVASSSGAAVVWGRSTGVLSFALTVEMAALASTMASATVGLPPAVPLGRAADDGGDGDAGQTTRLLRNADRALRQLDGWFADGVITAHQHRSPYGYRGPHRRLQLTFDVLGKLAHAAAVLGVGPPRPWSAAPPRLRSSLVRFETGNADASRRAAAVWCADRPGAPALVPFVGGTRSDYLPAPREPGLFDVPVDSDLVCWLPLVAVGSGRFTVGGVPATLHDRGAGGVEAVWDRLVAVGHVDPHHDAPSIPGNVQLRWWREGRAIRGEVSLALAVTADAITLTVPEALGRPLGVAVEMASAVGAPVEIAVERGDGSSDTWTNVAVESVDTAGITEWRSFWNELPVVHEADLRGSTPALTDGLVEGGVGFGIANGQQHTRLRYRLTVEPKLRVSSSAHGHHYHESLYGPMQFGVLDLPPAVGVFRDKAVRLEALDLFHLHWPEWTALDDPDAHHKAIDRLRRHQVPVVWTVHNLTPHDKNPEAYDPLYQGWADVVDVLIHHSVWGSARFNERYHVPSTTVQEVIPHGHFGPLYSTGGASFRAENEAALGLAPAGPGTGRLRIGLVGAPRAEKDLDTFFAGVRASHRTDIEVVCWSRSGSDADRDPTTAVDPRMAIAEVYEMVDEDLYGRRLGVCDVLAMPFGDGGDMLATGTTSDAVGLGLPILASSWPYLHEYLGDGALPMGDSAASIASALNDLTPERVAAAAAASTAKQAAYDWTVVSARTKAVFEALIERRG